MIESKFSSFSREEELLWVSRKFVIFKQNLHIKLMNLQLFHKKVLDFEDVLKIVLDTRHFFRSLVCFFSLRLVQAESKLSRRDGSDVMCCNKYVSS